jgi:hypothetical protein
VYFLGRSVVGIVVQLLVKGFARKILWTYIRSNCECASHLDSIVHDRHHGMHISMLVVLSGIRPTFADCSRCSAWLVAKFSLVAMFLKDAKSTVQTLRILES